MGKDRNRNSLIDNDPFSNPKRTFGLLVGIKQVNLELTDGQMAERLGVEIGDYANFKQGKGKHYLKVLAKVMVNMDIKLPIES